MTARCPNCNQEGRSVENITLRSLIANDRQGDIGHEQYSVCPTPDCPTVYFNDGGSFDKAALRVRFGLKETTAPRLLCYCFDHTVEQIHDEIARTGQSTVLDSIKADMEGPGCRCKQTNPLGVCCLKTVKEVVKDAFRIAGKAAPVTDARDDCCADRQIDTE